MKKYVVNDIEADFYTMKEMANLCQKRTKFAFRFLIKQGVMPQANLRAPARTIKTGPNKGQQIMGDSLYSKDVLAPLLIAIFKGINQGKTITPEQRSEIHSAFETERKHFKL